MWFNAEFKKPTENEDVLCLINKNNIYGFKIDYWTSDYGWFLYSKDVVAWQPLPNPKNIKMLK